MRITTSSLGLLVTLVGVSTGVALPVATARAQMPESRPITRQSPNDLYGRLNSGAAPETAQWGQLAGVWDCTVSTPGTDGSVRRSKTTWTWAYVIDGYAVQDFYVGHRTDGRPNFHGSGFRKYSPVRKQWDIVWFDNNPTSPDARSEMREYSATYVDEQVVMRQEGAPAWRTVFFDIRPDSFEWMNEPSGQRMSCGRVNRSDP